MIPILLVLLMQAVPAPVYGPTESYVVAVFAKGTGPPLPPVAIIATLALVDLACDRAPSPVVPGTVLADPSIGLEFSDPDRVGRACVTKPLMITATTLPLCTADPCPLYDLFLQAINTGGRTWSLAPATPSFSVRALPTIPPTIPPACLPPLGNRAVSVFPTNIERTGSGGPGSRARANYQLASPNSPITAVRFRIDGVVAASLSGDQLLDTAGMWFTVPPSGTHTTSLQAVNDYGCSREVAGPGLTVP